MLQWPGQVVIAGAQTHWTKEVSEALIENRIDELYKALMAQVSIQKINFFLIIFLLRKVPYVVLTTPSMINLRHPIATL